MVVLQRLKKCGDDLEAQKQNVATRNNICKTGMDSLPRGFVLAYYTSVFLYYWVFSTPVVSLVFGSYLFACINWLHLHFDEAFSSLRIANYKSFLRCHITPTGDMDIYTLAIDKVGAPLGHHLGKLLCMPKFILFGSFKV
jgi:hypothetical protein